MLAEPAPDFREIAARPSTTLKSLRLFLQTTHWDKKSFPMTMPGLSLSPEQIEAVACYIVSLRPGTAPTREAAPGSTR